MATTWSANGDNLGDHKAKGEALGGGIAGGDNGSSDDVDDYNLCGDDVCGDDVCEYNANTDDVCGEPRQVTIGRATTRTATTKTENMQRAMP